MDRTSYIRGSIKQAKKDMQSDFRALLNLLWHSCLKMKSSKMHCGKT